MPDPTTPPSSPTTSGTAVSTTPPSRPGAAGVVGIWPSGPPRDTEPDDPEQASDPLAAAAAVAILDTPGVVRIEPTLLTAVRRLTRIAKQILADTDPRHPAVEGVRISRHERQVDIAVDISIAAGPSALDTARAVRASIAAAVLDADLEPGRIDVAVLAIEHDAAA